MKKICQQCGYFGFETTQTKGSFGVEIALWILGLLTFGFLLLIALPYTIWRFCSKTKACPKCGGTTMIPVDTPVGKELMKKFNQTEILTTNQ